MTVTDSIKVPGVGPAKKQTVYLVGGVVVVALAVGYYRSKHQAPAATPAAAADQSSGQVDQTGAGPYDGSGSGYSGGASWPSNPATPAAYTTNAEWAQAAEDYLVNTVQESASAVGAALGKYLTGQPLTSDQVVLVQQAIAFANYPPVNGPTGHPPSYYTVTSGGGGSGSGLSAPSAPTVSAIDKHGATLTWGKVSGANHYVIYYKMNGQGTVHQAGSSGGTSFRIGYFPPATRLTVWVNAVDSSGNRGASSSTTSFATHH